MSQQTKKQVLECNPVETSLPDLHEVSLESIYHYTSYIAKCMVRHSQWITSIHSLDGVISHSMNNHVSLQFYDFKPKGQLEAFLIVLQLENRYFDKPIENYFDLNGDIIPTVTKCLISLCESVIQDKCTEILSETVSRILKNAKPDQDKINSIFRDEDEPEIVISQLIFSQLSKEGFNP